jgi:hypothetical protein
MNAIKTTYSDSYPAKCFINDTLYVAVCTTMGRSLILQMLNQKKELIVR